MIRAWFESMTSFDGCNLLMYQFAWSGKQRWIPGETGWDTLFSSTYFLIILAMCIKVILVLYLSGKLNQRIHVYNVITLFREVSMGHLHRVPASQQRTLTPPDTHLYHLGLAFCSYVETIHSWICHVYGIFEFWTSFGPSILLGTSLVWKLPGWNWSLTV